MTKVILTCIILIITASAVWAQNVCTQVLRNARSVYDEGRLHEIPDLLQDCIDNGFTTEEKVEAYRLLTLSYIYLDEPNKADQTILSLLKTDPLFEINETLDPEEFINLYNEYRTWPILRLGLRVGANATTPNLISANGSNDFTPGTGSRGEYDYGVNFSAAFLTEVLVLRNLAISSEIHYSLKTFDYKNEEIFRNTDGSIVSSSSFTESQSWLELQLLVQYHYPLGSFVPYLAVGGSGGYLITEAQSLNERDIINEQPIRENTIDIGREALNYSLIGAVGLKRAYKRGFFVLDARYAHGLVDISQAKDNLQNYPEYYFDYYGNYNEFKLSSLTVSLGYIHNIYNPKKITK